MDKWFCVIEFPDQQLRITPACCLQQFNPKWFFNQSLWPSSVIWMDEDFSQETPVKILQFGGNYIFLLTFPFLRGMM